MVDNLSSYQTIIHEGWIQYAFDHEYGQTPVIYVGHDKGFTPSPLSGAKTGCEGVYDEKWEELFLLPEMDYWGSDKVWKVKITVELIEEKEVREKHER